MYRGLLGVLAAHYCCVLRVLYIIESSSLLTLHPGLPAPRAFIMT